jgi:cytoskeletal protein CcmA (bactofilin family)
MTDSIEIVEDENKIDTVIADDINFKGKIIFKNSLKIKGTFEGQIETEGHLIIGQEAKVNSEVKAGIVSVSGELSGRVKAGKCIELFNQSKANCDLITPSIYIEKGCVFNGACLMKEKED